jgi:hypothetical protein
MSAEPSIFDTKLQKYVMYLWDEAVKFRKAGISLEDVQRGLKASLLDYVRARGLVQHERDMPFYQMHRCAVCRDDGWQPTTRIVRGEAVEAYKPCACKSAPQDYRKPYADAADKVARGWK